jgi:hypothetical protein
MRNAGLFIAVAGLLGLAGCVRQCPPPASVDFTVPTPEAAAPAPYASAPTLLAPPAAGRDVYSLPPIAPTPAPVAPTPGGDVVILLSSDTFFGPSTAAQAVAARFYCSSRGKIADLVSRERPKEMQNDIFVDYSVLTYHCVIPAGR